MPKRTEYGAIVLSKIILSKRFVIPTYSAILEKLIKTENDLQGFHFASNGEWQI